MTILRDSVVIAIIVLCALNVGLMQVTQYPDAFGVRIVEDVPREPFFAHVLLAFLPGLFLVMWRTNRMTADALRLQAAAEKEARYHATHDPPTGLGNRRKFLDHIECLLKRIPPPGIAVILVDLDGFKAVNDRHGHHTGDALLQVVAGRMNALAHETALCARLGGDEFAFVIDATGPGTLRAQADDLAARICETVRQPVSSGDFAGLELQVSASVGVACPTEPRDHSDLLRAADKAMYAVKLAGKDGWRLAV